MKQNVLAAALFLCICAEMAECGKNDAGEDISNNTCDCDKINPVEVTDLKGTVNFDETFQKWYIAVPEQGTYDVVKYFYPCNPKEAYQKANIKVRFSGTAFGSPSDFDLTGFPAGAACTYIELSAIELSSASETKIGTVKYYAPPDNCNDYMIVIDNKAYKPNSLQDEFKIDNLRVEVTYQEAEEKHNCGFGGYRPVINIIRIEKV